MPADSAPGGAPVPDIAVPDIAVPDIAASDIAAAGAVLWRLAGQQLQIALVHRPRYDDWSLPKGKLDPGESAPAAAIREVREETGFGAALGRRLGQQQYLARVGGQVRPKTVDYWAARALDGEFVAGCEVDQLSWLSPAAAAGRLSHDRDRAVLDAFTELAVPTATVLLVRHGKAGERARWTGNDNLRPLTAAGQVQAQRLAALLQLFGPTRLHCAPKVRCLQTMTPLAQALGLTVRYEPLLTEGRYTRDPAAATEHLLRLADPGGTVAVCSQGGVIPHLVRTLAGSAAADEHGHVPSRKGSTWVLSLHRRRLLGADYYAVP